MVPDAITTPIHFSMPGVRETYWWKKKLQKKMDQGLPTQFPADIFSVTGLVKSCESGYYATCTAFENSL